MDGANAAAEPIRRERIESFMVDVYKTKKCFLLACAEGDETQKQRKQIVAYSLSLLNSFKFNQNQLDIAKKSRNYTIRG